MSEKSKILIVDDETVIHKLFQKMFSGSEQYELLFATNGEDGLSQLEQEQPAVVVLDYRMLGATGDEFMTRLSDYQHDQVKIIMISGHAVPEMDLSERNQRKLFAYFEKPFFEITKLKQTIEEAAGGR